MVLVDPCLLSDTSYSYPILCFSLCDKYVKFHEVLGKTGAGLKYEELTVSSKSKNLVGVFACSVLIILVISYLKGLPLPRWFYAKKTHGILHSTLGGASYNPIGVQNSGTGSTDDKAVHESFGRSQKIDKDWWFMLMSCLNQDIKIIPLDVPASCATFLVWCRRDLCIISAGKIKMDLWVQKIHFEFPGQSNELISLT